MHLLPSLKLTYPQEIGRAPIGNESISSHRFGEKNPGTAWHKIAAWATLLASEQRRHHPTGGAGVFQRLGKKEELGGGFKYVYVLGGGPSQQGAKELIPGFYIHILANEFSNDLKRLKKSKKMFPAGFFERDVPN